MVGPKQSAFPGDSFLMKENGWLTITSYESCKRVGVKFEDTGYETFTELVVIRRGTVRDYMKPSVYGVGFLGIGPHTAYTNNKASWAYTKWVNMLERCYSPEYHAWKPSYLPCRAVAEWHNFQNFAEWAIKQVGYGNRDWGLEKGILCKGNKLYGNETCCFVPFELNALLIRREAKRGDCPIGVSYHIRTKRYHAQHQGGQGSNRLGSYTTAEAAFAAYKISKELFIKQQANKWRSQIDPRAYEALMNYEVLIID